MNHRISLFVLPLVSALASGDVVAEDPFLQTGKRFLVQTEGRKDYSPRIVECSTSTLGVCLRDTRGQPPENPIEPAEDGHLTVTFESWGITYLIASDGTGTTLKGDAVLGSFKWSLIDL